ncbi:phosphatidate cytidylyltransferase [Microbacterium gorillae]|uniref:phosphatidate cytidylyltransferase n=1 Tax=Microbacterium gorillae TaxID=1231063 RepID=UPI000A4D73AD|nr:phosphatidate cytidylyltransferase [Microbacterium gorillae]
MTSDPSREQPTDRAKPDGAENSSAPSGPTRSEFESQVAHARENLESQVAHARENIESQVAQARESFDLANERIKERTGRDLLLAIATGVVIGAVVLGSLLFLKESFVVIVLAGGLLATWELTRAFQSGGRRIDLAPQLIVTAGLICSAFFVNAWTVWMLLFVGIAVIVIWRLLAQMSSSDGRIYGDVLADVMAGGFIAIYVSLFASMLVLLLREPHGELWALTMIAVAVAADTGAYVTGLTLGKHPMAPRVSPNKTWEGFAGGALFALVAGVLMCWLLIGTPWWVGLIVGAAILASATLGDLGESMLKRDLRIKDMSSWFPGHGGLLDRLDSILPSVVVIFALYQLFSPLAVAS